MAWSTIRRATKEDQENLNQAAIRFCKRHAINTSENDSPILDVEFEIDEEERECKTYPGRRKLKTAWLRIVRRVTGNPSAEGIAYGYVGFNVD